jgi:hypothetical protein
MGDGFLSYDQRRLDKVGVCWFELVEQRHKHLKCHAVVVPKARRGGKRVRSSHDRVGPLNRFRDPSRLHLRAEGIAGH